MRSCCESSFFPARGNVVSASGGELGVRPLSVDDAAVMAVVLADPSLYCYTGGAPPSEAELTQRYSSMLRGTSPDGREEWINLLVTLDGQPIGYVQATVADGGEVAEIAWVIGRQWQGRGYAKQAVGLLVADVRGRGVCRVIAHIHPDHRASQRVAEAAGLSATDDLIDGEVRWVGAIR